jgi:hypothetical protein
MTPLLEVTEADRVPPDAAVCHYDELTGDAKHVFPEAVVAGRTLVPGDVAEQVVAYDVIKFTSYYWVSVIYPRVGEPFSVATTTNAGSRGQGVDRGRASDGPLPE